MARRGTSAVIAEHIRQKLIEEGDQPAAYMEEWIRDKWNVAHSTVQNAKSQAKADSDNRAGTWYWTIHRGHEPTTDKAMVEVNGIPLDVIEYKGEPVVTFEMLDRVYGNRGKYAAKNFSRNKHRFLPITDFYHLTYQEVEREVNLTSLALIAKGHGLHLLTERGFLKLNKTFSGDLAWRVQDELVDTYFSHRTLQEQLIDDSQHKVESIQDAIIAMCLEQKENKARQDALQSGQVELRGAQHRTQYDVDEVRGTLESFQSEARTALNDIERNVEMLKETQGEPDGRYVPGYWIARTGRRHLPRHAFSEFLRRCQNTQTPIFYSTSRDMRPMPYYTPDILEQCYDAVVERQPWLFEE